MCAIAEIYAKHQRQMLVFLLDILEIAGENIHVFLWDILKMASADIRAEHEIFAFEGF